MSVGVTTDQKQKKVTIKFIKTPLPTQYRIIAINLSLIL